MIKYMAKNMLWSDIEKLYPDQWAFVDNIKYTNGYIITSCDVLTICSKADKIYWLKYYMSHGVKCTCMRTTENMPTIGYL